MIIVKPKGGRLKAQTLVAYITQEFKVDYSIDNIYRLLHQLGFSWITSRSRHPKQSDEVQEAFKKFEMEMILTIPWNFSLKANRCFSGYEDIVNECSRAWNIFCFRYI
ncbi:MAG: hypothetical protein ACJA2G_003426 [Cognaticolwellia sp.]|jgi:hypothetical protein